MRFANCHPDRRYHAKGLCRPCYKTARWRVWSARNPDKCRVIQKRYRDANRHKIRETERKRAKEDAALGRVRARHLKREYNLTPEQWDAKFEAQGRRCGCCGSCDPYGPYWHTDHNHTTGQLRDILCGPCNCALGYAKESASRLRRLADYLDRHGGFGCLNLQDMPQPVPVTAFHLSEKDQAICNLEL
jgi:hypothetical protein